MDAAISPSASALAKEQLTVMEDLPIIGRDDMDDYDDDGDDAEVLLLKQQLAHTQKQFKKLLGKVKFVDKVHKVQILELKHRNLQLTKDLMARDEALEEKGKQIGELRDYIRELQGSYPDDEDEQTALRDRQAMMKEIRRLEDESRKLTEQNEELEESNCRLVRELEKAQERRGRVAESTSNVLEDNHRRVLEENKHLKNKMVDLSMSETNLQYKLSSLEDEHEALRRQLRDTQGRIVKLEDWLDQVFQNEDYRVVTIESLASADGLSLVDVINDASKLAPSRTARTDKTKLPDISENNLTPRARVEKTIKYSYQNRLSKARSVEHGFNNAGAAKDTSTAAVKAELAKIDKSLEEMEQYKPFTTPRQKVSPRRSGGYRDMMRSGKRMTNLPTIDETDRNIESPEEPSVDMAQSLANLKARAAAKTEEKSSTLKGATSSDSNFAPRRLTRRHRSRKTFSDDNSDKPSVLDRSTQPPRPRPTRKSSTEKNKLINRATFISSIQVHTDSETEGGDDGDDCQSPIPQPRPVHPEPVTPNAETPTQTTPPNINPPPPTPVRTTPVQTTSPHVTPPQSERSRGSRPASAVSSRTPSVPSGRSKAGSPGPAPRPASATSRPSSAFRAEPRDEEEEETSPIPEFDDDDEGDTTTFQEPATVLSPIAESERSNDSRTPSPTKRNKRNLPVSEYTAPETGYRARFNKQKTQWIACAGWNFNNEYSALDFAIKIP